VSKPSFARRAEIDVAVQLAHDQDVEARHDFRLQRRRARQLRIADRRTEVREELQVLAQAEDRLLGTQRALELVVFPVADRAEQDRVGFFRERQRGIGQRMALRLIARATDRRFFKLELLAERVQHLDRFGGDFRTDPVAGQYCNLHRLFLLDRVSIYPTSRLFSHGCFARRSASYCLILSA
jgi:hypothetical protein